MNNTLYSIALAAVLASTKVSAEGFAPWPRQAQAASAQATVSHTVSPQPFYSAGLPRRVDVRDAEQRTIRTVPFYLAGR